MNWGLLLEKWYRRKLSIKRIESYINSLNIKNDCKLSDLDITRSKVSCVQRRIQPVNTVDKYIESLHGFVRQAAEEQSQLIVFPEYNFFDLFGLIPGFGLLNAFLQNKALQKNGKNEKEEDGSDLSFLSQIFNSVAKPVELCMDRIFSLLADAYGIYIYTGSYICKEDGKLFNAGSLYGPDGTCLGTQKKLHLTDFECRLGMTRGCEIKVFSLPFGKIAFPVCMDATYFETFRIAGDLGADIVILPIANMEEYHLWRSLRGIWPRVQESHVYGLKSSLNGWIAGMHFTGKAGIFAPLGITPGKDGILALSSCHEGDSLVTAIIDIRELHKERENAEYYGDKNPEFEKNFVKKAYYRIYD